MGYCDAESVGVSLASLLEGVSLACSLAVLAGTGVASPTTIYPPICVGWK
jgi:hypothetical protein